MRYFFNFYNHHHTDKFYNKELFYQRLLNKRMGKTYILHKNIHPIPHYSIGFDYLNGYLIEFDSIESFSKFKLGFRKLFNPNLPDLLFIKDIISFCVEDNFKDQVTNIYNEYNRIYRLRSNFYNAKYYAEAMMEKKTNVINELSLCENYLQSSNEQLQQTIIRIIHDFENIEIKDIPDVTFFDERLRECISEYEQCFKNIAHHNI